MKRKFDVITDSACDMPTEYYKKHGVVVVRLGFTMNNVNYEGENGEKISEKEFYRNVVAALAKNNLHFRVGLQVEILVEFFGEILQNKHFATVAHHRFIRLNYAIEPQ